MNKAQIKAQLSGYRRTYSQNGRQYLDAAKTLAELCTPEKDFDFLTELVRKLKTFYGGVDFEFSEAIAPSRGTYIEAVQPRAFIGAVAPFQEMSRTMRRTDMPPMPPVEEMKRRKGLNLRNQGATLP